MTEEKNRPGMAFFCDEQGRVQRLIQDDLELAALLQPGRQFSAMIVRRQVPEALNLLLALKNNQTVFAKPLTVDNQGQEMRLLFSGTSLPEGILILAVPQRLRDFDPGSSFALEEFTRLNNELSNLHRSMMKQNVELNRLNDLKNEFLGMAAHDLRGSLGIIQMYCQILEQEAASRWQPEYQEYLSTISETAGSLHQIVDDYLHLSTIESGKLVLHLEKTELEPLLKRSLELNRISADAKRISLRLLSEASPPPLQLDEGKILQVINNLLENAIKYSQPGSPILLRLPPSSSQEVIFSVEDQGEGIAPEDLESIFEMFERRRKLEKPQSKGSGLGLAIAKSIVQAHGGRIWVESRPGEGSVFSVALPLHNLTNF